MTDLGGTVYKISAMLLGSKGGKAARRRQGISKAFRRRVGANGKCLEMGENGPKFQFLFLF